MPRLTALLAGIAGSALLAASGFAQDAADDGAPSREPLRDAEEIREPVQDPSAGEPEGLDALLRRRSAEREAQAFDRDRGAPSSRPGTLAILRGLDKVTARTRDFEAPVGETVEFGALGVTVRYCRKRPPEEPPEVFAFVQVDDRRTDGFGVETDGQRVFSGWMFASNPALNPLEHPVYDVWVIDCRS